LHAGRQASPLRRDGPGPAVVGVATGRQVRTLAGHTEDVRTVAISPDGRLALSGSGDKTRWCWSIWPLYARSSALRAASHGKPGPYWLHAQPELAERTNTAPVRQEPRSV